MSGTDLHFIRTGTCKCAEYSDDPNLKFKLDGHVLTTNCLILPTPRLQALCRMGAKYRPSECPSVFGPTTKSAILDVMHHSIQRFASEAVSRAKIHACMDAWRVEVTARVRQTIDSIPQGTLLTPNHALPYPLADRKEMTAFLRHMVCMPMDKADQTFVFQCPQVYVGKLVDDLAQAGTYEPAHAHSLQWQLTHQTFNEKFGLNLLALTDTSPAGIVQSHNDFISRFGIDVDMDCQEIPYYKGTVKMHKNPPDARFLSSSERSSMLPISKVNAIQLEVPPLFASALQSMQMGCKQPIPMTSAVPSKRNRIKCLVTATSLRCVKCDACN